MHKNIPTPHLYNVTSSDIDEVIDLILNYYKFDMSGYSKPSLRRRFIRLMDLKELGSVFELKHALINQEIAYLELVNELTVNVTEMFRDPDFFVELKKNVFPYLKTFPHFRIWHAGCSTGQEMYSLAILLKEAGLLSRSTQYGTDINSEVLDIGKSGIYDIKNIQQYTVNYQKGGGTGEFSDYYTARYGKIKMSSELNRNMTFSMHNLAHDKSFNEFQLIICRNVLIYFDMNLQKRVFKLFSDSLNHNGYVALGTKEKLIYNEGPNSFKSVSDSFKIYHNKFK